MELRQMDLAEVRNLVKWLDEQQRKGRQELAIVQQQFSTHQRDTSDLARRIQELESQSASLQAQIVRIAQVDQQMEKLKTEIVHLVEQHNDKRVATEKEMERLRAVEYDSLKRAINEFQPIPSTVTRVVEQMEQRKAEEARLSTAIATLQNQLPSMEARIDERARDVSYLEEAQRQDARRIAESQQELVERKKSLDALQSKQLVLEDSLRRIEAKADRLVQTELERKQQVAEFIEQSNLSEQRNRQQYDRWQEQLDEHQELLAGYAKQWRLFEEQHRLSKEATSGLLDFKSGIDQRQRETSELQRVESERMRQQWLEFLAEDDRRQKERQLEAEQAARERQRQSESIEGRFRALQDQATSALAEVKRLYVLQEKYAEAFRQYSRIWQEGYESVVTPPLTRKVPG